MSNFYNFPESKVLDSLDKQFSRIYNSERRRACNSQWKLLTMDVYPTEYEFTSLDGRDLYDLLLRRILTKQKEKLFEESERYLKREFIGPIIDDAQAQLNSQIKILSECKGGRFKLPEDIANYISNTLDKQQRALRRKKANKKIGNKVYSTFSIVKNKIDYRAKDIAVDKFNDYLKSAVVLLDANNVKRTIMDDLPYHVSTKSSFAICLKKFEPGVKKMAVDTYMEDVADSNGKFRTFLERTMVDNQELFKTSSEMVFRNLTQVFHEVRNVLAKNQMDDLFTPLQSGEWTPSYDLIEEEFNKVGTISIYDPLAIAGISSDKFKKQPLIEETNKIINEKIKDAINKGRFALKTQFYLVNKIEQKILAELSKLQNNDNDSIVNCMIEFFEYENKNDAPKVEPVAKRLTFFYIKRLSKLWSEKITSSLKRLDKNYSVKYGAIFDVVKKSIGHRIKSILYNENNYISSRLENSKISTTVSEQLTGVGSRRKKSISNVGSGIGSGSGIGTVEADVLVDVKHAEGSLEVSIDFSRSSHPVKVILTQGNYGAEFNPIVKAFNQWIKAHVKSDDKVRMDVVVRIFSKDIHYGVVAEIRRRLKHQIAMEHSQEIDIQWTDMLYLDE